jgi:hypothetical protein
MATKIIFRQGKTKRDHQSGANARRFANRQERVTWQHDPKADGRNFPYNVCNGKRNRSLKTEKRK